MVLTKVPDLAGQIRFELRLLRSRVRKFGLSKTGQAVLLEVIEEYEKATVEDLRAFHEYQADVAQILLGRLENVRDIPRSIQEQIADAHDLGWMDQWRKKADEASYLCPMTLPKKSNGPETRN